MIGVRSIVLLVLAALSVGSSAQQAPQPPNPAQGADKGIHWEQGRTPQWELAQAQRLSAAIAALKPERPGVVDAYLVAIGLDADPVFARETAESAKVLARRYDAAGRTIMLAAGSDAAPNGSPAHLNAALAAVAARMNKKEDALILYATTHGGPQGMGLIYRDGTNGYGMIAPERLAAILSALGIERRVLLISACFSGQFVGPLATPESAIVTASDHDRASFGCAPSNDWTYFGDALINHELRKPQPLEAAANKAFALISQWEFAKGLTSSKPRLFIGPAAKTWLAMLEKRIPSGETAMVGRPAIEDGEPKPAGR
jgi:hypothetical protein